MAPSSIKKRSTNKGNDVVLHPFADVHFDWEKETPMLPVHTFHTYEASDYNRIFGIVEPPASFDGSGYNASIEHDGMEFRLGFDVDEVMTNPHHIHSYLTKTYSRAFSSNDSSKAKSWSQTAKTLRKKQFVFRYRLAFQCESIFADDLENPGIDFIEITRKDETSGETLSIPLLLFEFKSVKRVEDAVAQRPHALRKKTFQSPDKMQGVKGLTSDYQRVLQRMMDDGFDIQDASRKLKRGSTSNGGGCEYDEYDFSNMDYDSGNGSKKTKGL
jgi:hypothetical protein